MEKENCESRTTQEIYNFITPDMQLTEKDKQTNRRGIDQWTIINPQ